jgi:hypothetical protein
MIDAFNSLTELQLNGNLMTWLEMQTAIASMPHLRLVEMGYNKLAVLSTLHDRLPDNRALQVINLDSNMLSDWVHVCTSLYQYPSYVLSLESQMIFLFILAPRLERVVLTSNCISTIPLPEVNQHQLYSLKHISLSFNNLNAWGDVDSLSFWCPALESLTLGGNPLMGDILITSRACCIISNLKYCFNRSRNCAIRSTIYNSQDSLPIGFGWGTSAYLVIFVIRQPCDLAIYDRYHRKNAQTVKFFIYLMLCNILHQKMTGSRHIHNG